jgi:hypothetical protein
MLLRTVWDISYQFLFLYVLIAIITGAPSPHRDSNLLHSRCLPYTCAHLVAARQVS